MAAEIIALRWGGGGRAPARTDGSRAPRAGRRPDLTVCDPTGRIPSFSLRETGSGTLDERRTGSTTTRFAATRRPHGAHHRPGRRCLVHRRRRAPDPAGPPPARAARQDRDGHRVRHQQLRRVHGADGRAEREVLLGPRGPGRRQRGDHHRGARDRRRAAPGAEGVPRAPRPPVRLLHAGDDHGGLRAARREPVARPRTRCARAWRATSAGAPATRTS